jgi:hypothetical protein
MSNKKDVSPKQREELLKALARERIEEANFVTEVPRQKRKAGAPRNEHHASGRTEVQIP